jgi:hypothetical protein
MVGQERLLEAQRCVDAAERRADLAERERHQQHRLVMELQVLLLHRKPSKP